MLRGVVDGKNVYLAFLRYDELIVLSFGWMVLNFSNYSVGLIHLCIICEFDFFY